MTQAELAARLQLAGFNLDRAAIAKIECRYRTVTDVEVIALADALGVSPAWLFERDDTISAPVGASAAERHA
jgi:transcriptional regulator with XRE-family HTH domain